MMRMNRRNTTNYSKNTEKKSKVQIKLELRNTLLRSSGGSQCFTVAKNLFGKSYASAVSMKIETSTKER